MGKLVYTLSNPKSSCLGILSTFIQGNSVIVITVEEDGPEDYAINSAISSGNLVLQNVISVTLPQQNLGVLTASEAAVVKTQSSGVWSPALSTTVDNTSLIYDTIAKMSVGDILRIPFGAYRFDITTTKGIKVVGSGRAAYTAGALYGGTIIKGQINIQDAIGAEVSALSLDQTTLTPSNYPNGITAGLTTKSSTTKLNQRIFDVSVLGRTFAGGAQNSQHGILVQNGRGCLVERTEAYRYLNLFISRASGVIFNDCEGWDAEANIVLIKSESTGGANDALDNTAVNVRGFASSSSFPCNFTSLAQDATGVQVTRNTKFMFCTARSAGGPALFSAIGTLIATSNRDTKFGFCSSYGDTGSVAFLQGDDFCRGVTFVGCHADEYNGFSFRSNAVTTNNFPSATACTVFRSDYPNATNTYGSWSRLEVNG